MICGRTVGLVALRVRRHTFVVITIAIFFVFQLSAINFGFTGGTAVSTTADPLVGDQLQQSRSIYAALAIVVFATCCQSRFDVRDSVCNSSLFEMTKIARGLGVKVFREAHGLHAVGFAVGMGAPLRDLHRSDLSAVRLRSLFDISIP